jgi:hypothetical protein
MRGDGLRLELLVDFFIKPVVLARTKKATAPATPAMPREMGEGSAQMTRQAVAHPRNASPEALVHAALSHTD